jgi:hypothetical protein
LGNVWIFQIVCDKSPGGTGKGNRRGENILNWNIGKTNAMLTQIEEDV